MALIKIKSESMNLADDYAFTGTVSGAVDNQSICKAYVHFNGTGTLAVNESFNVSSVTDNGTGNYTVNLSDTMSSSTFPVSCFAGDLNAGTNTIFGTQTTTSVQVKTIDESGPSLGDAVRVAVIIFGELA
jgi:hypothetical protein